MGWSDQIEVGASASIHGATSTATTRDVMNLRPYRGYRGQLAAGDPGLLHCIPSPTQ